MSLLQSAIFPAPLSDSHIIINPLRIARDERRIDLAAAAHRDRVVRGRAADMPGPLSYGVKNVRKHAPAASFGSAARWDEHRPETATQVLPKATMTGTKKSDMSKTASSLPSITVGKSSVVGSWLNGVASGVAVTSTCYLKKPCTAVGPLDYDAGQAFTHTHSCKRAPRATIGKALRF
eukprot:RCo012660